MHFARIVQRASRRIWRGEEDFRMPPTCDSRCDGGRSGRIIGRDWRLAGIVSDFGLLRLRQWFGGLADELPGVVNAVRRMHVGAGSRARSGRRHCAARDSRRDQLLFRELHGRDDRHVCHLTGHHRPGSRSVFAGIRRQLHRRCEVLNQFLCGVAPDRRSWRHNKYKLSYLPRCQ